MYVLICNQNAGNFSAVRKLDMVRKLLDRQNVPYHALVSESADATSLFLHQQLKDSSCSAVVIIGGDGTLHSVLQVIVPYHIPIAFLPAGSGNDTARNLGITDDPQLFVERLLLHDEQQLDVLLVNGKYGLTVAGFGLDASIGERAESARYKSYFNKIGIGRITYTVAALFDVISFRPFKSKFILDGVAYDFPVTWLISCGNMRWYGGGLEICPEADPTNAQLNLTVLHSAARLRILFSLFPALLRGGTIIAKEVRYATGRSVRLEANRILPLVVDGEIYRESTVDIQIIPSELRFLTT
ncbi:diacylglycerol kinase family protein [Sporosarcina sp. Te-1]|uniref:diacylglycerol/lipid kinase family protein n=1 Tax=Sporosarcina sp. Te-1 TaxID=2818390 RepID=UPI001A9E8145|nr:diacylglycerol kinase family protein [Sporosarcina sp. Te-1]QTD41983.1 NAD(+)/NADH kinase [Sporosarcina sp. Te-1]